jgi:flagellar biosynthesis/type III secretory pathway M-ring protein FliF/YscJ
LGGYNVLREYNWSQTSQQFNETRLRALQEELELTIERGSDLIDWARVQLTEKKDGLFPSDDTKATAAVKVGTHGREIPTESVEGIQWTVANALPGLKPVDVIVTDENSRRMSGFSERTETERVSSEQRKIEQSLSDKRVRDCARILNPLVGGSANYTIVAEVKVNYDKKSVKEKFVEGENPFERRRRTEEISDKSTEQGGIPGTPSNNPDDTNIQGGSSSGTNSTMTQETSEIDNEPRITRETTTEIAPGEIKGQWISIFVNQVPTVDESGNQAYTPRTKEEMTYLEKALKAAAAHIDSSTNYSFVLEQAPFDRSAVLEAENEVRWKTIRTNLESVAFLIAALLSIAIFFYFLRKVFSMGAGEEEVIGREELALAAPKGPEATLRDLGLKGIGETGGMSPEDQKSKMIKEEIENYAKGSPEDFVGILRNWLAE